MARSGTLEHYAREIELRWAEFLGAPAVLSPSDWRWISEWHRRGIPLELIAECIEDAAGRRRRGSGSVRPRGLSYLAPGVDRAWAVIVDGRTMPASSSATSAAPAALAAWRLRVDREPPESALRSLLEGLIAQVDAGADPAHVDAALSMSLAEAVRLEQRQEAEREARARLKAYRSRLTAEQFHNALRLDVARRLRRLLQLPRLESSTAGDDRGHHSGSG